MPAELFRNDHYRVEFNPETRVLWLIRTAVPQTVDMLDQVIAELLPIVIPLRPARVLIDLRLAPGNNDPAFEQRTIGATRGLLQNFEHIAVLIQTAIGRLHMQRLNRENLRLVHVFTDESEALRFLGTQPLSPPQARS